MLPASAKGEAGGLLTVASAEPPAREGQPFLRNTIGEVAYKPIWAPHHLFFPFPKGKLQERSIFIQVLSLRKRNCR